MNVVHQKPYQRKTFMNYELEPWNDALINYLIPSLTSFLVYIFLFASDIAVIFRHYKDENPVWALVTLFIIFVPSLFSYVVIISSWELWPEMYGCGRDNCVWFLIKSGEHLFFPIWAMWRYAERIFWSIEATRSRDLNFIASAISTIVAPRTIELYFLFQTFLHSLPQMLLQLNILMRQDYKVHKQTFDAEILSFVFNLARVSATVTFYQRFKSQKIAGKQYPWFKNYKKKWGVELDLVDGPNQSAFIEEVNIDEDDEPTEDVQPSVSRRSSDFYLEPLESAENPEVVIRETSVIDGPMRPVFQEISEPDFGIRRVTSIKGLPEDDLAGKLVSFLWWSCFLLARILAIAAFYYFYPTETIWLLVAHVFIIIAFLIYDVKTDNVKKWKALFFLFIGLIYIFCIIEFKIKFKKAKLIYCGYFSLVFLENFIMCIVWWVKNVEDLENDFWFRYIFFIVAMASVVSVSSMILYLNIYKPQKVVVGRKII